MKELIPNGNEHKWVMDERWAEAQYRFLSMGFDSLDDVLSFAEESVMLISRIRKR